MNLTESIVNWRRYLKRRNYSAHTVKTYLNGLKHFVVWLGVPIEQVTHREVADYIEHLLGRGLSAKTINGHLGSIRGFYDYLGYEHGMELPNPVKRGDVLRLPKPLPRHLSEEQIERLFGVIRSLRDRAIFKIMLRCGLRVEEVSELSLGQVDLRRGRLTVQKGKGGKGRVVYLSEDAHEALVAYLRLRSHIKTRKVFLVEKGTFKGQGISVRGIQKRMEYYANRSGLKISCHHLRHTMATQLLNADAELVSIQDLLGHSRITTTQRYSKVSNVKVQRDYYKAMAKIINSSGGSCEVESREGEPWIGLG